MPDADLLITAAIGAAGIVGTLVAPLLSARSLRHESLRQERSKLYADALAHALAIERQLNAIWISSGADPVDLLPRPAGEPLTLVSMDAITVRMRLFADRPVEASWSALVSRWEDWQWWGTQEWSGDPDESPPESITDPLREAISALNESCKRALR